MHVHESSDKRLVYHAWSSYKYQEKEQRKRGIKAVKKAHHHRNIARLPVPLVAAPSYSSAFAL